STTVVSERALATGFARLYRGDPNGALAEWNRVIASDGGNASWWVRVRAAHADVGIATAEAMLGRPGEAARHLERAIETYRDVVAINEETEYRLRLDRAARQLQQIRDREMVGRH